MTAATRSRLKSSINSTLAVARVGRPHGLKGDVELHLMTDRPDEILGAGRHTLSDGRTLDVEGLIERGGRWFWNLGAAWPPERIKSITGFDVVVEKSALPTRPDGEYGEDEIVGLRVEDTDGNYLGEIIRIDRRYEVDTWILSGEGELPAVAEFVKEVDIAHGVVRVAPGSVLFD